MCQTILVPLDGTAQAEQALPLAQHLARRAGAALRLIHVHIMYLFKERSCGSRHYDRRYDAEQEQKELAYLDAVARRLAGGLTAPVSAAVVQGVPVESILAEARRARSDLIVLATRQHDRLARIGFGSVADELLRQALVPVLLVPAREPVPARAEEPTPRHVLIPLDGSAEAEHVLGPALHLGGHLEVRFTLLRVVKRVPSDGQDASDGLGKVAPEPRYAEAQDYLESIAWPLRARSLTVQTRVVAGGTADGILWEAGRSHADLIALATHACGGLKRLFLGSVADHLHRHSPIPVLIHRIAP